MKLAVTYARSSKDRADVSIDVQRAELARMAAERGLTLVDEYTDVVESGKDEDRAGFQRLYDDLRARGRRWDAILVMDTSRLSRRIAAAYWFEDRECKPLGVEVLYRNLPDMDPAERALVKAVFHGVDEWHSLVSKRKGLSGMRQNVQSGFRAGGRAPLGYQLERHSTGAVRDGQPVTKSRLVPDPATAAAVGRYLQLRAAGETARNATRQSGLSTPKTTLRHMEWNALTYAGCTVWNVHAERVGSKAIGGHRRRPRSEWVIKEDTHEPLITRAQAEILLVLAESTGAPYRDRALADYLLSGILRAADGRKWQGCRESDGRYYRLGRRIKAERIERAVVGKVSTDLRAGSFVQALLAAARRVESPDAEAAELARAWTAIEDLDRKIGKVTALLAETDAKRPLMVQIEKWETEREKLRAGIVAMETRLQQARQVASITARDIEKIVAELAANMADLDPIELRDFLRTFIDQITLEPTKPVTLRISYKIPMVTGDKVASPRRPDLIPALMVERLLRLAA